MISVLLSGKLKSVWECLPSKWWNFPVKQKKEKKGKHQWLWALLTAVTVVTLEGLGGSSLIFCSMFQVCMCHLILGSYREQALDQELDFSQVTMRQITLKSYRLQHIWMIFCTTTTTTAFILWKSMTFCTQCHSIIIDKLKMMVEDVTGISLVSQERLKQCVFKVSALPNSGSHNTACQFIYDWMWKRCNSIYSVLVVLQGSSGGVAPGYKPAKVPGEWKIHGVSELGASYFICWKDSTKCIVQERV